MGSVAINKSTMNILKKLGWEVGAIFALVFAVLIGFLIPLTHANANPLRFPASAVSATATTSPTFLTTAATSTIVTFDTYSQTGVVGAGGSTQAADKAALNIQFAASSTSSVLLTTLEYSQDGIDWYTDDAITPASPTLFNISSPNVYSWTAAGTATSSKTIIIPTPERYVRAKMSISGAAGAVWAQIVSQKQST